MLIKIIITTVIIGMITVANTVAQPFPSTLKVKDPWTKNQLMEPAALAALISDPKSPKPVIFNIGVVDNIKGARNMGAASEELTLRKFKKALSTLPKSTTVVVYCGCCPFSPCPNIRPAFKTLQAAGFTNARLLNLQTNLKTDWISKGYPIEK